MYSFKKSFQPLINKFYLMYNKIVSYTLFVEAYVLQNTSFKKVSFLLMHLKFCCIDKIKYAKCFRNYQYLLINKKYKKSIWKFYIEPKKNIACTHYMYTDAIYIEQFKPNKDFTKEIMSTKVKRIEILIFKLFG